MLFVSPDLDFYRALVDRDNHMHRPIPMTGLEATIFNRSIRECQSQCRDSSVLLQDISHYNAESGMS